MTDNEHTPSDSETGGDLPTPIELFGRGAEEIEPPVTDEDASTTPTRRAANRARTPARAVKADTTAGTTADGAAAETAMPPPVRLRPAREGAGGSIPPNQEFFIPIHGFVRLSAREVTIVDHPAFRGSARSTSSGKRSLSTGARPTDVMSTPWERYTSFR